VLGHPVRTNWYAASQRLAEHDDVGLQSPGAGESSEVLRLGVSLIENEQRAGPPGERSKATMEARLWQERPLKRHRRLRNDTGDVVPGEHRLDCRQVIELDDRR